MRYIHGLGSLPLIETDEGREVRMNIFDESGMVEIMGDNNQINYLLIRNGEVPNRVRSSLTYNHRSVEFRL
ncbi:hypothetical protein PM10SUCC1_22280 [Propionigenium maris DSM 9537]|uniref:Uncharacterized protein n=1 Tax=Propionigenium maris DSM 9537 TaxID=1123000 RepID=A0A9W6GMU1_9FUSO|nr:hypothetical protein [Propionigenium maris]GLI56714.1 hypothetical protein PM10SUCC1_22280 [Propionigenium maris DSM 9537]